MSSDTPKRKRKQSSIHCIKCKNKSDSRILGWKESYIDILINDNLYFHRSGKKRKRNISEKQRSFLLKTFFSATGEYTWLCSSCLKDVFELSGSTFSRLVASAKSSSSSTNIKRNIDIYSTISYWRENNQTYGANTSTREEYINFKNQTGLDISYSSFLRSVKSSRENHNTERDFLL